MQFAHRLFLAATLAVLSTASVAATVYTSSAAFLSQVAPGSYTETFSDSLAPDTFSNGVFSYEASAPGGVYHSGDFLGTNQILNALTITFTSGNVTALGANFFATNFSDAFQSLQSLILTLSDGTVETFTPLSQSDSYRGFTSDVAISSLVIALGAANSFYPGLDNLTVGTTLAVPEPTSLALVGVALLGLRAARRRPA